MIKIILLATMAWRSLRERFCFCFNWMPVLLWRLLTFRSYAAVCLFFLTLCGLDRMRKIFYVFFAIRTCGVGPTHSEWSISAWDSAHSDLTCYTNTGDREDTHRCSCQMEERNLIIFAYAMFEEINQCISTQCCGDQTFL